MKKGLVALAIAANVAILAILLLETASSNYAWGTLAPDDLQRLKGACYAIFWASFAHWAIPLNVTLVAVFLLTGRTGRKRTFGLALGLLAAVLFVGLRVWALQASAAHYLTIFETQSVAEPYLERPIAQAGAAIGPLLLRKIQDPGYPRRRYAIAGLGDLRFAPAVPVLSEILFASHEPFYVRGDAYEALVTINTPEAWGVIERFWRQPRSEIPPQLLDYLTTLGVIPFSASQHPQTNRGD